MKKIRDNDWWLEPQWQNFLQEMLLFLGRQRYNLVLSKDAPWGHTSFSNKTVEVNPVALKFPQKPSQRDCIRNAPQSLQEWQQAITLGLIQHEAAHIRFSGWSSRPQEPTLGWLWNTLEDERIERLMIDYYPQIQEFRELLCDAAWFYTEPSSNLLIGCLLWRWEWHRLPEERKFNPGNYPELQLWQKEIRPLVEKAWIAKNSDEVVVIAKEILHRLEIPEQQPLSSDIPFAFWDGSNGEKDQDGLLPKSPATNSSLPSSIVKLPGSLSQSSSNIQKKKIHQNKKPVSPPKPREVSPHTILTRIEGYARDLALALKPPIAKQFRRPHSSRGELNLQRALEGHQKPFNLKQAPAPSRSVAMLVLIDQSGSMKGKPLNEAIAASLLLDRAASIAEITLGVWGFYNAVEPTIYRPLAVGHNELGQRLIAGIQAKGDTFLTPVFQKATQTLVKRPERVKFLIIFHDGLLNGKDATSVKEEVKILRQKGIFLQPIYIGNNPKAVKSNKQVFGQILACSDVTRVTPLLLSWLRALF